MQYQMFLVETADDQLNSIQQRIAWVCQHADRYGELQKVFVASLTIPILNANVEREEYN